MLTPFPTGVSGAHAHGYHSQYSIAGQYLRSEDGAWARRWVPEGLIGGVATAHTLPVQVSLLPFPVLVLLPSSLSFPSSSFLSLLLLFPPLVLLFPPSPYPSPLLHFTQIRKTDPTTGGTACDDAGAVRGERGGGAGGAGGVCGGGERGGGGVG